MINRILCSPDSQAAPSGGQNGVVPPAAKPVDPRDVLAAMVAQQDQPASPATNDPATPPAQGDPEPAPATPTETEPGQEISPAEEQPPDGNETPADEPTEPESPEPTPVQKRIDTLTAQKAKLAEENAALKQQIEEARTAGAAPVPAAALPEAVARLKTPAECDARLATAEQHVEAIQDYLDENPGDATTVYSIGEKQVSRQELIATRARWRAEIKTLPLHKQALTAHAELVNQRRQASAAIRKDFPELADPEHTDTKLAMQFLNDPRFQSEPQADYLALALARGHRELQAELASRKAKGNGHKPAVRPAGAVPSRKPMTSAGAAGPAPGGDPLKNALKVNGEKGSRGSLAALVSAAGR